MKKLTPKQIKKDADILALEQCCDALMRSTSKRMLHANLVFIYDRFIFNPAKEVRAKFK